MPPPENAKATAGPADGHDGFLYLIPAFGVTGSSEPMFAMV